MRAYPKPGFLKQSQTPPRSQQSLNPLPDSGEKPYEGSGRLSVAFVYALLAFDEASYVSGTRYGMTGGQPLL